MIKKYLLLIFLLCAAPAFAGEPSALTGTAAAAVFPALSAKALDDSEVVLPDSVKNKVSLIILTFSRPDDKELDSWVKPFDENFRDNSKTAHYEIAMIGDIGFINGLIFNGMKGGATEGQKKHLLVYFHDKEPYKRFFSVNDDSLIYIYLLDRDGAIKLAKSGRRATDADTDEIISLAFSLLKPKKIR